MKIIRTKLKKSERKKIPTARKLAFSAILCALGVVILFTGSLIEVMDLTMAAFASFLTVVCVIEIGGFTPVSLYAATSILSFVLLPNKSVVLIYIIFFGYYPILKKYLERLVPVLCIISKFAVFNAVVLLSYRFAKTLLFADADSLKLIAIALLNIVFIAFDFALSVFVTAYVRKLRIFLGISRIFRGN